MSELKSIREILEELAAMDEHTREDYQRWCLERDRAAVPKKPPASEPGPDTANRGVSDAAAAAG